MALIWRCLLVLAAAVLAAGAETDPCLQQAYAEENCALPSAPPEPQTLAPRQRHFRATDADCCARGNYKKDGHQCDALPPGTRRAHAACMTARAVCP